MKLSAIMGIILLILASMLIITFGGEPVLAEPDVIRVPENHATIQEAIDAANPGDTIIVSEGTYAEGQINVNKPLTLRADGSVIVDGLEQGHVFQVTAGNVTIEAFVVANSRKGWGYSGIRLQNVEDCFILRNIVTNNTNGIGIGGSGSNIIKENNATKNRVGIGLYGSRLNVVEGNIANNNLQGIHLFRSDENLIRANVAIDNGVLPGELGIGIYLEPDSDRNLIEENMLRGNRWTGIMVWQYSDENVLTNNTISNSFNGVYLTRSSNNTIYRNSIDSASWAGVKLRGWNENNRIIGNSITNMHATGPGLFVWKFSHSNVFTENLVADVPQWVYLHNSSDNVLYHNTFTNAYTPYGIPKILIINSTNIWDNGYPSGGNYWSDHEDSDNYSGPYQNETGNDGIVDTPYVINEYDQDEYPLREPWGEPAMIRLVMRTLRTWDIHKGTENSLTSKLEGALHLLEIGNEKGAIQKLMDFIDHVRVLKDNKLTEEQKNYLISEVQKIIERIRG